MYEAINKGLALSRGEIVAYLNSDDLYLPWAVETAVGRFAAESTVDIVYGDAIRMFVASGRTLPWLQAPIDRAWLLRWGSLIQPAVFWRRSVLDEVGNFDTRFKYAGDLDYWLRAASEHRIGRVDELLAIDRWHAGAASVAAANQLAREAREVRRRNGSSERMVTRGTARIRAALLRRLVWFRFVAAARGQGAGWPKTREVLKPRISTTSAILGLLPMVSQHGLASIQWSEDPVTLAGRGPRRQPG